MFGLRSDEPDQILFMIKKNSCLDHGQGEFMAGDNVCQERIYSIWSNAVPNIDKVVIMINRIHMLLIYI